MNKTMLILSGPTHEYIDPVRFIGNASSGLMGKAIAEEAAKRNYRVDFLTGPVPQQNLPDLGNDGSIHKIVSAEEMLAQAEKLFSKAEIIIFAAAVADYTSVDTFFEKLAKTPDELTLRFRPTPDIAKTLCAKKRSNQTTIGFALQTSDAEANARRKLEEKHFDGIVLNTPDTLGASNGTFSFLARNVENFIDWGCIDKTECAKNIMESVSKIQ